MDEDLLTEELVKIAIELDARNRSCNLIYDELNNFGWDELCDKAINIIEQLKH